MKNMTATLFLVLLMAGSAIGQSGFHLIKKTVIGGEGGWDYLSVDSKNRRLYVSHSTQVEILNADTHEKIGVIPNLKGVHGVMAIPKIGRGILTNGRANTVIIFDLKTLQPIVELPTGKNPDALMYDEFSKRAFIFNHSDVTTTAIDVELGKVVGTVDVGGTALEAGTTDGKGNIFVNLENDNMIVSFDAKTLAIKNKWKISPGEEPTGLSIDLKAKRLFSVCHNGWMMVIDSETGSIVTQLPIGKRVDGVVFDQKLGMAFSSNGEGTITVVKEISPSEFKVVDTIQTEPGARTIALDPKTHHIFVTTAQYGETPAPTAEIPNPRPKIIPGTFMILEYGQ